MKFSEQWVREWVNLPGSTAELVDQLTLAGLEVDAVEPIAPPLSGVVVGRITALDPHPNAVGLTVCQVEVGQATPLQIVCGAANARPGLLVPVALEGAQLAGDRAIVGREIHGIRSQGMLCSAAELGLEEHSDALLELPEGTPPGEDISRVLALGDVSIEVDLTPNRGDCLSLAGIARELSAINRLPVMGPPLQPVAAAILDTHSVFLQAEEDCPRYVGRVVRGINPRAGTPLWMRERLRRSGLRSLGPVVDVTNYVMLELGQPMHAFDLRRLSGPVRIRRAAAGEAITLLDGQEVGLSGDHLVIVDDASPQALAGIMGGQATAVSSDTVDLFLESAHFAPHAIAGRARRLGLQTDSAYRFERGVDPELPPRAMERATALLLEIGGGEAGPIIDVRSQHYRAGKQAIQLRQERIRRLLGLTIPDAEIEGTLRRLGMEVRAAEQGWTVFPPSFRFDIAFEADLIEEVGRLYGYSRLPSTRPQSRLEMSSRPEGKVAAGRLSDLLVDRGYHEAITYSFTDPQLQALLDPAHGPLVLSNPLAENLSAMRTSLWPGLVQATLDNQRRQQTRLRLFEAGLVFLPQPEGLSQRPVLAALATGTAYPEQWGEPSRPVDFYDIKGDVEAILQATGCDGEFQFVPGQHPALHPGQATQILRHDRPVGWIGAIHPGIESRLELLSTAYIFALALDEIEPACIPRFEDLSKFPAIRRDLAIVLDEGIPAQAVHDCIIETGEDLLKEVRLFDLYQGKGVREGKKSLALGLILQHISRTLTDQEVDAILKQIIERLDKRLGASLRGT
jgi:phenylalanyl-tRNA synthetase beta chain